MPEKLRIKKKFARASDTYDDYSITHKKIIEYLLSKVSISDISKQVLDLGSGTGLVISSLKEKTLLKEVVSVDIAYEMLKKQQKKFNKEYNYIQSDIDFLPFKENSFNFICSSTALQWSDIPYISNIFSKYLNIDKYFAVAIISENTFKLLRQIKQEIINEKVINFLPDFFTLKDSFLDNKNLEIIVSEKHLFYSEFKNIEDLFTSIRALGVSENDDRKLTDQEIIQLKKTYLDISTKNNKFPYLEYEVSFFIGKRIS